MSDSTPNIIGMCLREARKAAGYDNTGQAAVKVSRSPETVGRHERGDIPLSTEDAIQYAQAYGRPDIMLRFCDDCRIHKALYGEGRMCERDLPWCAMRTAARFRRCAAYGERLEAILDDGIVDSSELPELVEVFSFWQELGRAGREMLAACMSQGILKNAKEAAPAGTGATERAKITLSKADQIAHLHCTTV